MGQLESKIQKDIVKWLEFIGCKVVKLIVANKSGNADLIICYKGYYIEFEVKKPLKEATKLQVIKGQETIVADGAWFCIHSVDEAKDAITEVRQRRGLL